MPTFVATPLIVFVVGLNVTPSGRPLTLFVTTSPLLSVALISMLSISVFTSLVWSLISFTVGAVVSTTLILNFVSTLLLRRRCSSLHWISSNFRRYTTYCVCCRIKRYPSGRPLTLFVTTSPLLSVALISMSFYRGIHLFGLVTNSFHRRCCRIYNFDTEFCLSTISSASVLVTTLDKFQLSSLHHLLCLLSD